MKVGMMGAMLEEIALMQDDMNSVSCEEIGGRKYYSGKLYDVDTALVFSRWGKVASAATVATLINKYKVDCIIFTGVAGAIAEHLNVGDIVISNQLYQHDMDASPIFKKHEIPLTGKTFFDANQQLISNTEQAAKNYIAQGIHQIKNKIQETFSIHDPKIHIGKIASGDLFVNAHQQINRLKTEMPDVMAVEMEGAAVAQVCAEHNVPFVVIRTISDKANHSAAIDFQSFVTEVAKHYSKGIVENLFKNGVMNL